MTDENRISTEKAIFQEAILISDVRGRDDYLTAACRDNVALRRRIDALLESDEGGGSFMRKQAIHSVAVDFDGGHSSPETPSNRSDDVTIETATESLAGQTLGHYQIVSLIGAGG